VKFPILIAAVGSGLIVSAPVALGMILGIALTFSAIAFAIHARQVRVQYQVWLRQIGQMTAVVVTDAQGVITWVSERFTSVTGYQFEEALGLEFDALISRGESPETAIATLGARWGPKNSSMLAHLAALQGMTDSGPQLREIRLREVVPGMILMDDLRTDLGTLLVSRGYEISHSFIDRMRNFGPGLLEEPVRVRISRT
jgi:hypothetical protein